MTATAPTVPSWSLRGDWFDTCKCNVPCPCTFAQLPTFGECEGVLAWHIREGSYGDVRLDGLNVVMLGSFVGNAWAEHSDAYAAVFVDERADERQREAIQMIFGGEAGGWPAEFAEMFGAEMRGMEFAPVRIEVDDDLGSWRAEVPGRVRARAEALTGPTTPEGARVQSTNLPGSETGPGQVATWGRSTADQADAYGFAWSREGQSSKHITFDWTGPG
ncbi:MULTISPECIES: DUF1326 domain-containing protein [unclassified Streptomyces]|uniref:DUF1326 domain-containing protein n=1 Tax=unclassified Streptomyces TaxID=2593676 RepID=UPI0022B5FC66|nr:MULTISPECIES: DUF1326 domain-containing protein [unclassified Streptomyces]MCZ7417294.1 DUF1326 domain-containing protein [Streptomyces sp. WMMC897]MCZ7432879.1 DUF1326 domain-containing protein [Streptomyces sp. WMMC1477]